MSMVPTEVPSVGDAAIGSDLGLYNYQYQIKDITIQGQPLAGSMSMPLFAPSRVQGQNPLRSELFHSTKETKMKGSDMERKVIDLSSKFVR